MPSDQRKTKKTAELQADSENWTLFTQENRQNQFEVRTSLPIADILGELGGDDLSQDGHWPERKPFGEKLHVQMVYCRDLDQLQMIFEDPKGHWDEQVAWDLPEFLCELLNVTSVNVCVTKPQERRACSSLFRGVPSNGPKRPRGDA